MISEEYKALEVVLLEYIERFGLTPSARHFFDSARLSSAEKNLDTFPVAAGRSA
ncbi:MAG: hypothetical protein WBB25_15120 [Sulfitobacter sp.]